MPAETLFAAPGWEAGPGGSGGWVAGHKTWRDVTSRSNLLQQPAGALHAWKSPDGDWELAVAGNIFVRLWRLRAEGAPYLLSNIGLEYGNSLRCIARLPDGATLASGTMSEDGGRGKVEIFTYLKSSPVGQHLQHQATLCVGNTEDLPTPARSLHFFELGGQELLLAASQDTRLYVLANPHTAESVLAGVRPPVASYLVKSLAGVPSKAEPDNLTLSDQEIWVQTYDGLDQQGRPKNLDSCYDGSTLTSEKVRKACHWADSLNAAAPSPDGRWVALVPDLPVLFLLDPAAGLKCTHTLEVPRASGPAWAAPAHELDDEESEFAMPGQFARSHYCAWSPDSRYLAASFSHLHWVGVWGTPGFQLLLSIQDTRTAPLAVAFSLTRPNLLAFSERKGRTYLLDVAAELQHKAAAAEAKHTAATLQCIKMPGSAGAAIVINCLASMDDSLLLTTKDGLHQYDLLPPWSLGSHRLYPARFRAAARALLMCASKGKAAAEEGAASVHDLPMEVVQRIVQRLAGSFSAFFPPCGQLPTLTLH